MANRDGENPYSGTESSVAHSRAGLVPQRDRPAPFAPCGVQMAAPGRDTWAGESGLAGGRRGRQTGVGLGHSGRPVKQSSLSENAEEKTWGSDKGLGLPLTLDGPFCIGGGAWDAQLGGAVERRVKGSGCNDETKTKIFDRDTPCLDIRGDLRVRRPCPLIRLPLH